MNTLRLHVLGSGSKGNATIIENTVSGRGVLVDCGICKRELFVRSEEVGFDIAQIEAIMITHEHTDHTKGLGVVLRGLAKLGITPQVHVSEKVWEASSEIVQLENDHDIRFLEMYEEIALAGMTIRPFKTSHDSVASCGFRFEGRLNEAVGYITDSGIVDAGALESLRDCRILALESNHDAKMLATGEYPYVVKRRIASDQGHLSNEQSAEGLEKLLSNKLEQVVAMHISENNNTYRLPQETLGEVIKRNTHPAQVQVSYQGRPISVG